MIIALYITTRYLLREFASSYIRQITSLKKGYNKILANSISMKGIIINYLTNDSKDITAINTFLFGRVAKTKQHGKLKYYYYAGLLEDVKYFKLSNGSYFISEDLDLSQYPEIRIFECDLIIDEDELITAKKHFKKFYEGIEVNNL